MKIVNNPLLVGAHGKLANIIYKQYGDNTVASKYPDMSKVVPSEKQLAARKRFKEAMDYAKSVIADPSKRTTLKPKRPGTRALLLAAVSEFMKRANQIVDKAATKRNRKANPAAQ